MSRRRVFVTGGAEFGSTRRVYDAREDVLLADAGTRYTPVEPVQNRGNPVARGLAFCLTIGEQRHGGWGVVPAVGRGGGAVRGGDRMPLLSTASFADGKVAPAEPLPSGVSGPLPGEALGCAVDVVRRTRIRAGEVAAVVGAEGSP